MSKSINIGIVWAPASGKTMIASQLKDSWYNIFVEPARAFIDASLLDWKKYAATMKQLTSSIVQDELFQTLKANLTKQANWLWFHDTTLVDALAHRCANDIEIRSIVSDVMSMRYDHIFYVQHPGAFQSRENSPEKLAELMRLDQYKRAYLALTGYMGDHLVTEVPIMEDLGDLSRNEYIINMLKDKNMISH